MPEVKNKIKYGIKNCYYAVATIAEDGSATFGTPVALPGAVSLTLDPEGDSSPFYADNRVYYEGVANNGYTGSLELALVPDSFRKDVLGEIEDASHILVEDANEEPKNIALLFQFEGDKKATRHVLYNVKPGRTSNSGNTKTENVEPETESIPLTARPIYVSSLDKYFVKAKTTEDTASATYTGWFETVYVPTTL